MTHRLPILADFLFLHNLLSEKSIEHQSFEAISTHVQKKFNRNDFLSVGTLLSLLIKNNDLPETTNRLVAYYLLYDIFRSDIEPEALPKDSPFQYFLFSLIEAKDSIYKLNSVERNFIVQLMASGTKDVSRSCWIEENLKVIYVSIYIVVEANTASYQTNRADADAQRGFVTNTKDLYREGTRTSSEYQE